MRNGPFAYSRRGFIKASSTAIGGLAIGMQLQPAFGKELAKKSKLTAADLPVGKAPKPVACPHFPDRLHAFVWRNWPLVTPERMAKVVGAKKADIVRMGRAMGLGEPPRITRDQQMRSYITVIKRNWHLLPYEQILELLDWTPEQLAFTLREDDFLFIKLGQLKPKCEPVRYQSPDEKTLQREREVAKVVREAFPQGVTRSDAEPLFKFVEELSRKPDQPSTLNPQPSDTLRFIYSYFALYGDPLLEKAADPFPEGYLARLAQAGVNGVWLQGVLYKLAPFPWEPARSENYQRRLKNLRALVARAKEYGIKVFLYLNEPRAMPLSFFENRPHLKGVVETDHAAMCTSVPEVQKYLTDGVESVCRAVPDLGGFFTITFSENLTNCWSRNGGAKCPRCGKRPPGDVVGEINPLFAEGIRKAGTGQQLIAWDWQWDDKWAPDVIRKLPVEASFMSVSEWSLPIERGGVKSAVGEYSISAIGPGPRARRHWKLARERGLKTIAKIQAGNTWELSPVPYIPAVENVARHVENLRGAKVDGLMLSWTLGGCPSPNLEVVAETLKSGSAIGAMWQVAERRFGQSLGPLVVTAWHGFSTAFTEFPYDGSVLYNAPQQVGPSNLFWSEPTGYAATMVGFPYDALDHWRAIYSPEIFIQQFDGVADGFDRALAGLKTAGARADATPAQRRAFEAECNVAEACAIHFRTCANQARFVLARRALVAAKKAEDVAPQIEILERMLKDEIELARRLHRIQSADSRVGFEASNQYNYVPVDLAEKVLNCRDLLERWLPTFRNSAEGQGKKSQDRLSVPPLPPAPAH
jgi:hypothetical protein